MSSSEYIKSSPETDMEPVPSDGRHLSLKWKLAGVVGIGVLTTLVDKASGGSEPRDLLVGAMAVLATAGAVWLSNKDGTLSHDIETY